MNNEEKEINEEELEKANGGIKIVIDHENSKFIESLKNVISKIKKWRR